MSSDELHRRPTTDEAFHEWLLSDHPAARAERDWRRSRHYHQQRDTAADIAAWARRINADSPHRHTSAMRDVAASIGPHADENLTRIDIESAEPDELYVARLRTEFENLQRNHPDHPDLSYRYPARLTGPGAAAYPPPPGPSAPEPEAGR